jgi:ABC-2 type transport system permease protein
VLAAGYGLWLLIWAVGIVGVSAWFARGRDALVALLAVWAVSVVLVPRLAPELVASSLALPTRFETDIAVARDLAALGDSHDPDDPYFAGFKKKVLAQYGVSRVEDLPVNYKGLLGMEGERLTSALFERYADAGFERQDAQLRRVDGFAWLSPVIALRRLSMAAAGTDLQNYRRFVEQAEHHRYRLVQELNRLQAEKLSFADDRSSRDSRISNAHWHDFAGFRFEGASPGEALRRAAPAAGVLLLWLAALAGLLGLATRRLGRVTR